MYNMDRSKVLHKDMNLGPYDYGIYIHRLY